MIKVYLLVINKLDLFNGKMYWLRIIFLSFREEIRFIFFRFIDFMVDFIDFIILVIEFVIC